MGVIAHLRGRLFRKSPGAVILECAGVGYEAVISVATYTALPETSAEASLYIYTHVREDQIALFGFAELHEKMLFERLLSISGIGPKLAITVLSGIAAERLRRQVAELEADGPAIEVIGDGAGETPDLEVQHV